MLFQCMNQLGNRRGLLSDCYINTDNLLSLLVQNGIYCNRGFTGLTVSNNQLSLPTSDRKHGVNGKNTGFQRRIH